MDGGKRLVGRPPEPKFVPLGGEVYRRRIEAGFSSAEELASTRSDLSEKKVEAAESSTPMTKRALEKLASVLKCKWEVLLDPTKIENASALFECRRYLPGVRELFRQWELSKSPDIPLEIKTIAIDLNDGWQFIHHTVSETKSTIIHFKIVMLGLDNLIPPNHEAVNSPEFTKTIEWSRLAVVKIDALQHKQKVGDFDAFNKTVTIEIRSYRTVPTIHGMLGAKNQSLLLAFTSCRLQPGPPPEYVWGDDAYQLIPSETGEDGLKPPAAKEWLKRFNEVWNVPPKPLLSYDSRSRRRAAE